MTTYCKIEGGIVVNRAHFDGAMPDGWAQAGDLWVADEAAAIGWNYAEGGFSAPVPLPLPVDLVGYAADKRFRVETGGIVVNGATIQTDRASQAMITGAVTLLNSDADLAQVDFKASGGWVSLDRQTMLVIGKAVGRHVQGCFSVERLFDADIAAGTITAAAQIESDSRWPAA